MRAGEPVLLICHAFPPIFDIGGRRWAKFAKELARRGHPVHVIRDEHQDGEKVSLWIEDINHPNIIPHPVRNRYPRVLGGWPLTSLKDKLAYRFYLWLLKLRVRGNYFDKACLSQKDILRLSSRLIRAHKIGRVVVTGAPFHSMVYAAELKAIFPDLKLTVDFRDEWTWGKHYGLTMLGKRRMEREYELEAIVIQASDAVISPHEVILEHLKEKYGTGTRRWVHIPHVIDPEDLPISVAQKNDGIFRMIYAGSLYGSETSEGYFPALLDAFSALLKRGPDIASRCRLDLYITGQGAEAFKAQVTARRLDDIIHFHAPIPPKKILTQLAQADMVPVFLPKDKKDVLVTKLNELFHLRRPILHIGEPGLVSRTIVDRKLGASIRVDQLELELPKIIMGERTVEVDRHADHSAYLLANITDRLISEVLE